MLETIDEYLDLAKRRKGLASDSQLARELGFNRRSVSFYRTKRAWPSDNVMMTLAEWCGIDQKTALLQLASWRAEGPATAVWRQILDDQAA